MTTLPDTRIKGATVQFLGEFPVCVQEEIAALWPEVAAFVPRWVREVCIRWNPEGPEICSIRPNISYKWVTIYVTGNWLSDDLVLKRQQLLHEIAHMYVEPIAAFARETIESLVKEDAPKFHSALDRELTHRVEQSVQEVSWALSDALVEAKGENRCP